MHEFSTIEEVLAIHEIVVREFGGPQGLRYAGALESALLRQQIGYYNDLLGEAAALMESLAMNHPSVDGNKLTAFYTTDVSLRMNGQFMNCANQEAYELFRKLFETHSIRFVSCTNGWNSMSSRSTIPCGAGHEKAHDNGGDLRACSRPGDSGPRPEFLPCRVSTAPRGSHHEKH